MKKERASHVAGKFFVRLPQLSDRRNAVDMTFLWVLLFTAFSGLVAYVKVNYIYWYLLGISQFKTNFLWGNLWHLKSYHHTEIIQKLYDTYKTTQVIAGTYIFAKPVAVVLNLNVMQCMLFEDREKFQHQTKWTDIPDQLSKILTARLLQAAKGSSHLAGAIEVKLRASRNFCINIKEIVNHFTLDLLGLALLSVDYKSLTQSDSDFYQIFMEHIQKKPFSVKWQIFRNVYRRPFTNDFNDIINLLIPRLISIIERRQNLSLKPEDFLSILLNERNGGFSSRPTKDIAKQVIHLLTSSFQASVSIINCALYELAKNKQKQILLSQEIRKVMRCNNYQLSPDVLEELIYLKLVIKETQRLYPPLTFLQLEALADYAIPKTIITLDKGNIIYIPVQAVLHDPEIYAHSEQFQPERFFSWFQQGKHSLSFLCDENDPHNGIVSSSVQAIVSIALIDLLTKYEFSLCDKSPKKIEFSKYNFIKFPTNDIYLNVKAL
uniref:Cytochrome P450 n=1 Tax=Glossina palpalis gambiensis TaxID=67801 RepID=A0A1B0ANT5_9MUSC